MATQWMDDFLGYGTDSNRVNRMLDGPYGVTSRVTLTASPDPTDGGKYVCQFFGGGLGGELRKVLTSPQTVVGAAARFWIVALPSAASFSEAPRFFQFKDTNNYIHIEVTLNPSGYLEVYRVDGSTPAYTLLGSSTQTSNLFTTNSFRHIETKVVFDSGTNGSVEVRVDGIQWILINGIRTTNANGLNTCNMVCQAGAQDSQSPQVYFKDYIIWDGTTAVNNTFFGSCSVYRITPNADVSRNWNTVLGASPPQQPATTSTTGGTLAAGTYYYVVTAILNPQGESVASNEVSIATTGTTSSNTISWTAPVGMTVTGYKVYRGTAAGAENVYFSPGNVLTFTDTGGAGTAGTPPVDNGAGFSQINETTPDEDTTFITAGQSPIPAAYQATMTQLPANVSSVRSVMTIHRSRKTDGGDASLQASLVSGANTGNGAARPITTAYTWWWDIFETDPSGSNWNKTLVNALKLKLNRTV